jgi:hypothetical protein
MPEEYVPFSIREGIIPEKIMQVDGMDAQLRNSLWNVMHHHIFQESVVDSVAGFDKVIENSPFGRFMKRIWGNFFKSPIDEINPYRDRFLKKQLKPNFLGCLWHMAYDCIEFVAQNYEFEDETKYQRFEKSCNVVLEREKAGYRLLNKSIVKITNNIELESIKDAMNTPLDSVNQHIKTSAVHLSNRTNPDYRNSIKESISAVESICKKIVSNEDTTLGVALREIQSRGIIELHEDMNEAFKKLYGYTNDSGGIRHALMEGETEPDFTDAKFMLISCSAFVTYLIDKASKVGINFD